MPHSHLKNLLAAGQTREVIRELLALPFGEGDNLQDDILLQSARFEALEKDKRAGRLSPDQEAQRLAQINSTLLDIIKRLPEGARPAAGKRRSWLKWSGYLVGAITLLAAVAEFSGYSLRDLFWEEKRSPPVESTETPPSDSSPANPGSSRTAQPREATTDGEPAGARSTQQPTTTGSELNTQGGDIKLETRGDQSPAVISNEATFNYFGEDPAAADPPPVDTVQLDSMQR